MIYTTAEGQSFDPEILRQELVATLGETGWHINTSANQVVFVGDGFDPSVTILAHFDNGPAREQTRLKAKIKAIRETSLEKFPKNSGVDNVYNLNFQAATLGAGDITTVLRNGKSPFEHLGFFGAKIGKTAAQFAAYVIQENLLAGQKMTEIEGGYLDAYYAPNITEQMVTDYQQYCNLRLV